MLQYVIILRHLADFAFAGTCVDFVHELVVDVAVGHDMLDHALESSAGGIGAGEEDEEDFSFDVVIAERLAVVVAGVDECLEKVDAVSGFAFFDVAAALSEEFVPESHQHANAR